MQPRVTERIARILPLRIVRPHLDGSETARGTQPARRVRTRTSEPEPEPEPKTRTRTRTPNP